MSIRALSSSTNFRFENLLGLIGGGGETYSTDPDEKSREEEFDMRSVIQTKCVKFFKILFFPAEMTKMW